MKILPTLDLTAADVVLGRHAVWLPRRGIKVPFQWGGRAAKISHPAQVGRPIDESLAHEVSILKALAAEGMAPPIGGWVFFKNVLSTHHMAAPHVDPCGAWGYEMERAETLPPGRFTLGRMRELPIEGTDGAWNDVVKPGNVINGYLVDVRRTDWDMLRWRGAMPVDGPGTAAAGESGRPGPGALELQERVGRECQFPAAQRPQPYQEYFLGDRWIMGSRSVRDRAAALTFDPAPGESVLDVGCQSGGFLQHALLRQREKAGRPDAPALWNAQLAGVDVEESYIDCARDLARYNRHNICYWQMDVVKSNDALIRWAHSYFRRGLDHLLLLSMEKHIGEPLLWQLVDELGARLTYLETNAQAEGQFRLRDDVEKRGGRFLGDSNDRSPRRLYVIDRQEKKR